MKATDMTLNPSPALATEAQEEPVRRPRLLVVDDDITSILALRSALDHQLIMARSGAEALQLLQGEPPDLILLDVDMPGMDGYEVCRRLKSVPNLRDIPVVFITAHRSTAAEIRGLDAGAADFICKPVEPRIVRARVRTQVMLKQHAEMLRRLAYVDALTGVANRRQADERLIEYWRLSQRCGQPMAAMLIDVDHFKRYNDRLGHAQGDCCLRAVALTLKSVLLRGGDLLARYGGEEFVYLLPDTDLKGAECVAQRALQAVRELRMADQQGRHLSAVTVSLGLASSEVDSVSQGQGLLELADQRLYQAKAAGRDRGVGPDLGQGP
jgi:diguanylate cyclase (GGDEF)-like protein